MSTITADPNTAIAAASDGDIAKSRAPAWRRLLRKPAPTLALIVVLAFVAIAALAPLIAPYDPIATSWGAIRKAPSLAHWMGTDDLGRDVLARMLYGARASLLAGVVSVCIALSIGVPLGLIAGYAGGLVDGVISRLTDALLSIPFLILAISFANVLGPSLTNCMIAIGITVAPFFVRLTRAQTLSVKVEDYVEAARAAGNRSSRVLVRHIAPNVVAPLIVQSTLSIARAIIAESSLSFLGLGQQPPQPSWGSMLNVAKNFMSQAPWMAIYPGLAICLVVLAFNLLGDGLRDVLDPRDS